MDYANRLKAKKEIGVKIIKPFGNAPLHRVAIADYSSFSVAMDEVEKYRKEFGDDAWVLKY
jgi:hypothetical protein